MPLPVIPVDTFELPEWLGTAEVVWRADDVRVGHLVHGRLTSVGEADMACDLLAVDLAYPAAVTDEASRHGAHQAWHHGQVLVGEYAGRLTLAAPGSAWDSDRVVAALTRLAKSVGARPQNYAVLLRIGG
ncbi:MAG: hypothetical protein LT071_00475 [Nocardioides sp.]|nr:hypothetical protein [Nocardioides sp.]